jgi:hypothetical protein
MVVRECLILKRKNPCKYAGKGISVVLKQAAFTVSFALFWQLLNLQLMLLIRINTIAHPFAHKRIGRTRQVVGECCKKAHEKKYYHFLLACK